jgi:hypothetical protein
MTSSNEVHYDQMQYNMCKDEISKCSLWADVVEVGFILWVDLYS